MFPDEFNVAPPRKLFADFNCFFPRVEQQANAHFRGMPVAITNRTSPNPSLIAVSYEAKEQGVRMGMNAREARYVCPNIIILESDVSKYLHAHAKLDNIFSRYTDKYHFESIDEGVIDMTHIQDKRSMVQIAKNIKREIEYEIGSHMKVSIGIANSQWMGKLGSELHKPDGLVTIARHNYMDIYKKLRLTDLPYIAGGNSAKLMVAGISTVEQFYEADNLALRRAFKSITGLYWYYKLRGYELDDYEKNIGSRSKMFRLPKPTYKDSELLPIIQHQCHGLAEKLRYEDLQARGVIVAMSFQSGGHYVGKRRYKTSVHRTNDIYERVLRVFNERHSGGAIIVQLDIAVYGVEHRNSLDQMELFRDVTRQIRLDDAVNAINDRYGKFTAIYAQALQGSKQVSQKIPMGLSDLAQMLNS